MLTVLLLMALAGAPAQNPRGVAAVSDLIRREWAGLPASMALSQRVTDMVDILSGDVYLARAADTDDDGRLDLIVAPKAVPPQIYQRGPVMIYRGADLSRGRLQPYLLPSAGDVGAIQAISDVNGDGRTEVVVSYETHGSGGIVPWVFFRWSGTDFERIFHAEEDHWRGNNVVWLGPGLVGITCRPLGTYDHKMWRHRQHTEVWRWRDGAYRLAEHTAPPPDTDREAVNDAEVHFRRQEYPQALELYRQALKLPEEGGWRPYVHFRLGQTLALLRRPREARRELALARSGPLVPAAEAFAAALKREGVPAAFAAVLALEPLEINRQWRLKPSDLAPPAVMLQAHFAAGGTVEGLTGAGIPAEHTVAADLDGDGDEEVWVQLEPYDPYEPNGFLAVRGPEGWRVGAVSPAHIDPPQVEPTFPLLPAPQPTCRGPYRWEMLF